MKWACIVLLVALTIVTVVNSEPCCKCQGLRKRSDRAINVLSRNKRLIGPSGIVFPDDLDLDVQKRRPTNQKLDIQKRPGHSVEKSQKAKKPAF
jgi:hypothetical protein